MEQFREINTNVLIAQIGMGNILAISGGRVIKRRTGVTLPVSNGYSVTVDYTFDDLYQVSRVFTRAGVVSIKGTVDEVDYGSVGEVTYKASCFRNVEFPSKGGN